MPLHSFLLSLFFLLNLVVFLSDITLSFFFSPFSSFTPISVAVVLFIYLFCNDLIPGSAMGGLRWWLADHWWWVAMVKFSGGWVGWWWANQWWEDRPVNGFWKIGWWWVGWQWQWVGVWDAVGRGVAVVVYQFWWCFLFFIFFIRWCWWMWVCAGGGCRRCFNVL